MGGQDVKKQWKCITTAGWTRIKLKVIDYEWDKKGEKALLKGSEYMLLEIPETTSHVASACVNQIGEAA